jgi:hypothetical protein
LSFRNELVEVQVLVQDFKRTTHFLEECREYSPL